MAAIECGIISLIKVFRGDMLDVTIGVKHNLDLTGKTLYAEVREEQDADIILKLSESDGSLIKTITSETIMYLRFFKAASAMVVPRGSFQIAVVMGTLPDFEDKQTIITGTISFAQEIAHKPVS